MNTLPAGTGPSFVAPSDADVRARFNVAIRTAVVDRALGSADYGVGSGITWSSDTDAEHHEVVAKTAVLHCSHREFELIETMPFEPGLGLHNVDRHLRRLSESAEYFGFRFDGALAMRKPMYSAPRRATTSSMRGSASPPDTSLTIVAPASRPASATSARMVSTEITRPRSGEFLNHGPHSRQLFFLQWSDRAWTSRSATDIEDVRTFGPQSATMRDRGLSAHE
jgi:hypothetical protein